MNAWNDYLSPLINMNIESKGVLTLSVAGLLSAVDKLGNSELGNPFLMAASLVMALPVFIAFFFAQRSFIKGIPLTGLRG